MDQPQNITEHLRSLQPRFAIDVLGVRITAASSERIEAELDVTPMLANPNGIMHGGVVMALADNMGGTGTSLLLSPDELTTTIESKTNFLRRIPVGDRVRAISTPLHAGRQTVVWETRIMRGDGKLAATVTQTQIVMKSTCGN